MEELGIALVHEACPVCTKKVNEHIIMNSRLSKENAQEVESIDGKCIGFSEEPCEKCKEMMKKAFLFIIYDESKTDDEKNPYRTGHIIGVKKDCNLINSLDSKLIENGYAIIDINLAKRLGLIQEES